MDRIKKLVDLMASAQVDGYLLTSESNVTYLSGFTGDSSTLLVTGQGVALFTDGRYTEQAAMECHDAIEVVKWVQGKRHGLESYGKYVEGYKVKSLGIEGNHMNFNLYNQLHTGLVDVEIKSVNGLVEGLRMVKDQEELSALRTASEISDRALELTIPYIKEGVSEMEIIARLEYNLKTNGAHGLSFDSMVLAGAKTSLLHGQPDGNLLQKGDFVLFDFGALYKGYHADMSRTFVIGQASDKHKVLYDIIQKAEMSSIETLRSGITGKLADDKVREIIPSEYIEYYYPGLGHGVGLQVHEDPYLGASSKFELKENMVVTVEPGIYIPNWGGLRIEDTVLVKEKSFEIFNKFPRDLMIL